MEDILTSLSVGKPTQEETPRIECCGTCQPREGEVAKKKKRVHVVTLVRSVYGPKWEIAADALKAAFAKAQERGEAFTKKMAIDTVAAYRL